MFDQNGNPTRESLLIDAFLRRSGLDFHGSPATKSRKAQRSRLTCVVYRIDPITHYQFLMATAGVHDLTPMFGPMVHDDLRSRPKNERRRGTRNPYGFQEREGIPVGGNFASFPDNPVKAGWVAWLSARAKDDKQWDADRARFRSEVEPNIGRILEGAGGPEQHVFAELWHREREARNNLRNSVLTYRPLGGVDEMVSQVKNAMRTVFVPTSQGIYHLGVYLNTGNEWRLAGSADSALPAVINEPEATESDKDGFFTVVSDSTRPLLLSSRERTVWSERLLAGDRSGRLRQLIESSRFAGAMLIPILYPYDHAQTIALALAIADDTPPLVPADLFVMSKLAEDVGGHIAPMMPIAGYPYWPDLQKGPVPFPFHTRGGTPPPAPAKGSTEATRRAEAYAAAEELATRMLGGRKVVLHPLKDGKSGARVYGAEVDVTQERFEIPRVLKVGDRDEIVGEVVNYMRYVVNTSVGQSSRIEQQLVSDGRGAILYTFVGAGEKASQWSQWAKTADTETLDSALHGVFSKLRCWYDVSHPTRDSVRKVLIAEEFDQHWFDKAEGTKLVRPSVEEVREQLDLLATHGRCDDGMTVSVVHGDLHAGNVFIIERVFTRDAQANEEDDSSEKSVDAIDVAVIDWGLTAENKYVMLDMAKLVTDLLFHVRWPRERAEQDAWTTLAADLSDKMDEWGKVTRAPEWRYAYAHYLAKMLFYMEDDKSPHFSRPARRAAFAELQATVECLTSSEQRAKPVIIGAAAASTFTGPGRTPH